MSFPPKLALTSYISPKNQLNKQLSKEVNQAYIDATTAREKYVSSQKFVASAAEAARQVARKYDLGVATVVDYNTALNTLIKAQTQLVQAKYEFIFKMKIIRFYMNQTI